MINETKKKWVVIFLVYAELESGAKDLDIITKNNNNNQINTIGNQSIALSIETELQYLFDDILESDDSPEIEIFVIYNQVDIQRHLDWTSLYQKQLNDTGNILQRIHKEDNQELQKPEVIVRFFKEIEKNNPSHHRLLFTWDHGSIFGIFSTKTDTGGQFNAIGYQKIERSEILSDDIVFLKGNRAYDRSWNIGNSERTAFIPDACDIIPRVSAKNLVYDVLTNEELAYAISEGFSDGHVDILVMMNCCMMNVNTAYALYKRNAVHYFIAPQSEINFPAYNYREIFEALKQDTSIDPALLSRYIIQTLTRTRQPRDQNYIPNMQFWAILCLNLHHYAQILLIIQKLIPELSGLLNDVRQRLVIQENLGNCFPFDAYRQGISNYMIDLRTFLYFSRNMTEGLRQLHHDLEVHLTHLIVDCYQGPNLFPQSGAHSEFKNNLKPSGISIFFPQKADYVISYIFQSFIAENSISPSAFFSDTKWIKLICNYLSLI